MTYVDMAFVGLVVLWLLVAVLGNQKCCPHCGKPQARCDCFDFH